MTGGIKAKKETTAITPDSQSGFTLVELLVAMSVFIASITLSVGTFVEGLKSQRLLIQEMAANNAIGTVLEQMMRDVRNGYDFADSTDESNVVYTPPQIQTSSLSFRAARGDFLYKLDNEAVYLNNTRVTSENVEVKTLIFRVNRVVKCDPWRVTIFMSVVPKGSQKRVNVQTTVSSRTLPADLAGENSDYQECRSRLFN